jgi:hypothetical protein
MSIALSTILGNLYPPLHAASASDLVFTSDSELTGQIEDALKDLAQDYGVFVTRDITTITLATGTATYALPENHLATLHCSLSSRPLIPSSRHELERLDSNYITTSGTAAKPVKRWYQDKGAANVIGFHPVPSAGSGNGVAVEVIYFAFPCSAASGLEVPKVIADLIEFQSIGEMYKKESDFQMVEVAQSCEGLAGLIQAQVKNLWEVAQ